MKRLQVAVVGAGIAGLSAAKCMSERGHHVTLFEQHGVGHSLGSSHGRSRIVRRAYADPFYTECMQEAYPLWNSLERSAKVQLVHEVGLLYFGPKAAPNIQTTADGLRKLKVPHELLDPNSVHRVFPDLQLDAGEIGIFTPEAGWIDAQAAVEATRRLAVAAGLNVVEKRATSEDLTPFDKSIVAAGPWIRDWWPEAPVTVTLQTYAYLEGQVSGPVWIEDGADLLYGFPTDSNGIKIGVHRAGREIDPHDPDRRPSPTDLAKIVEFGTRRFSIASPLVHESQGCLYTSTDSEDFFLSQLDEKTILASACSGHGFKFGPWFGQLLADIVDERVDIACYGRFLV